MITRIVVAHDAGARVFEHRGPRQDLIALEQIEFESGRRQDREIASDRPGRSHGGMGKGGHAYQSNHGPKDHATDGFAKQLATSLQHALHEHAYQELVLIAPPRFLGKLRDSLSAGVAGCVVASIDKDLPRASEQELGEYLKPYLVVGARHQA